MTGTDRPDRSGSTLDEGCAGPIPLLEGRDAEAWLEARDETIDPDVARTARGIVAAVRDEGDDALLRYTERFDGVRPNPVRIPDAELRAALDGVEPRRREALDRARRNVERFHRAQRRAEEPIAVEPGVEAWREFRPIRRVGIYVPGGRAAYPSSLIMTAVPARVAGCDEIAVCCPPGPDGRPPSSVMAAAALLGVEELYAVGGAQAVAALAHGTASVPAVDKIFGPGSAWVNAAKLTVVDRVAIDLPAGPSEIVVWCDESTDPALAAAELLAQAEHAPDALCVAVVPGRGLGTSVQRALGRQLRRTARRDVAALSLERGAILVAPRDDAALRWVDELAAEHLVVLRRDASNAASRVRNAGSVFLGPWTPVAAGDYASGTNHVLPTGTRSRACSGLSTDDFGKWLQFQRLGPEGLAALGPAIVELAEWEGLPAHGESVRVRLGASGGSRASAGKGAER